MNKIKYFILITFLLLPILVNAESFKDGDTQYVFEERDITCLGDTFNLVNYKGEDLYFAVLKDNKDTFYRVNSNNECIEVTEKEALANLEDTYEYYTVEYENDKFVIKHHIDYYDSFAYIKTLDQEIVADKIYYEINDNGGIQSVGEPILADITNYYEEAYLESATGTTFDSTKTYYKYNQNDYTFMEIVTSPKEEELDTYYLIMEKPFEEKTIDILNQEKMEELTADGQYLDVLNYGENKFLIFTENSSTDPDTMNWLYDYYDINGNKIETFQGVEYINVINDKFMFVTKGDSFSLYNLIFEKVYENSIKNLNYLRGVYYQNNVHFLLGYDETNQKELFYYLNEYKVLDGEDQTFAGEDLKIRFSGDADRVTKVLVDDKELEKDNYVIESGSTIITLKKDYLKILSLGEHELKVEYNDGGIVSANFTIKEIVTTPTLPNTPNTYDGIITYATISLISLLGFLSSVVYLKKYNK